MNTRSIVAAALMLLGSSLPSAAAADVPATEAEKAAIEKTARDYIDGWYEGNAERMARALHPDLAKRTVEALPNGRAVVQGLSANTMIEWTRNGGGKQKARPGQRNQVVILDVAGNMAAVRTVSPDFTDLIHLAKVGGEWKIVNVLWEFVRPPAPAK